MPARPKIAIVLLRHFLALALGIAIAQGQTPPGTTAQTAAATNPALAEADQLSLEVVKLYQAGKYDAAVPLAKRALNLRETLLGGNHLLVAESLTNLAEIYLVKGKATDAESVLKRAVSIYDKNPTANGLILGKALDRLAALRLANADVKKAEELYRRALAVKEKAVGQDHAEVVFSMDRLADFYTAQKDYPKATPILHQVVSLKEKAYGKSHREVGVSLERLACALYRNNEQAESEQIEARANEILYSALAKKHEPFSMSPGMFECKMIINPRPEFPTALSGREGKYLLITAVDVDESGNVVSANMISGNPAFEKPAEQAALKAKFRPAIVDGRPVRFKGVIMHKFDIVEMMIGPVPISRP